MRRRGPSGREFNGQARPRHSDSIVSITCNPLHIGAGAKSARSSRGLRSCPKAGVGEGSSDKLAVALRNAFAPRHLVPGRVHARLHLRGKSFRLIVNNAAPTLGYYPLWSPVLMLLCIIFDDSEASHENNSNHR